MSVYIEYVILDNFIIDYIILYAAAKTLKLNSKWYRLTLGSAVGTVLAVLLPLLRLGSALTLLIKLSTGLIMVAAVCPLRLKKFIISYILFVTYTFVLGGCIIGVLFMLNADIYSAASLNYDYEVPAGLMAGICFIYIMLLIKLCRYIERRKNVYPYIRKIKLFYSGGEFLSSGFIDSGNRLYDSEGSPIMIINQNLAQKMINQETLNNLFLGTYSGDEFTKKEFRTTQNRNSCMYLFKVVKLLIYSDKSVNTIENVSVGIVLTGFKGIEGCDALLHSDFINN